MVPHTQTPDQEPIFNRGDVSNIRSFGITCSSIIFVDCYYIKFNQEMMQVSPLRQLVSSKKNLTPALSDPSWQHQSSVLCHSVNGLQTELQPRSLQHAIQAISGYRQQLRPQRQSVPRCKWCGSCKCFKLPLIESNCNRPKLLLWSKSS